MNNSQRVFFFVNMPPLRPDADPQAIASQGTHYHVPDRQSMYFPAP